LISQDPPQLHLELVSDRLDFDSLPDMAMFSDQWKASGIEGEEPLSAPGDAGALDINIRLSATEMLAGDAVAREAVLQLGGVPDCAGLDRAPN
jgi:hypothetical protein